MTKFNMQCVKRNREDFLEHVKTCDMCWFDLLEALSK